MPARELDKATVEVSVDGVPRATTQIGRRSLLAADVGTVRQLENRVASLPKLAADVENRRQEAIARIGQAEKALAEPFKHAGALKAAQADAARIDQLMADATQKTEFLEAPAATELDTELQRIQQMLHASFPQPPGGRPAAGSAVAASDQRPEPGPARSPGYSR
jgi:hypothetical protein